MSVSPQPQTSLYETTIEDPELEAILDERETLKGTLADARKAYNDLNDKAKDRIRSLDLGADAPVRVGRFVVTEREVEGRTVSFETQPSTRIGISLLPPD